MAESNDLVTLCVPVYNGAAFVAETLSSIQRQSDERFAVLVSVDASTDDSVARCRSFLHDDRFQVFEQEQRLGWVGNCNWLLSRVETQFLCIIPHDDILDPSYLARLLVAAEAHPEAAVAYTDIQTFGVIDDEILAQPSIRGASAQRVIVYLMEHYNAVAFRGLVRSEALEKAGLLQNNPFHDFAEDTVWLMKLVRQGEFVRVAEPLYSKRYRDGGVHRAWPTWSRDEKIRAWTHHCLELAIDAFKAELTRDQQACLLRALLSRLSRSSPNLGPYEEITHLSDREFEAVMATFVSRLAESIGADRLEAVMRSSSHYPFVRE